MPHSSGEFLGNERFTIRRRLGSGGMGVVYEAYDKELKEAVALKSLLRADASAIYRFKKEFRSLAGVTHPNLVSLYELIAEGDYWFFTMELVEGVTFLDYVTGPVDSDPSAVTPKMPTLSTPQAGQITGLEGDTVPIHDTEFAPVQTQTLDIEENKNISSSTDSSRRYSTVSLDRLRPALRDLAEGVNALHEMGKLHRDIKPSNVLVTKEGRVVILDFGLVTESSPDDSSQSRNVVGTPLYMSPEHGAGLALSEASDWYSVGVMLYEALAGRPPFAGQNIEVLVNKQKKEPPPPSRLASGIPEDLDALCRDLLRLDHEKRPSGREILERLGGTETDAPVIVAARPATTLDPTFVGRESHLNEMAEAFSATKRGQTVSVYIHGVSGMGKSSMVTHFLHRLQRREQAVVFAGRCYEQESVPYKAMDGVIDSLSKYLISLPKLRADAFMPRDALALSRLFPVLLRVESITGAPYREQAIPDPLELRRRAWAALRELLTRLADRHPLAVYIDDLQWADADSISLLNDLLRPPDSPPLLLVASFRSEEIESKSFLKSLLAQTGSEACRELAVGPLSQEEARSLTRSLLPPEMPGTEQFVETIVREAEGSPFFVEELTRYAITSEKAATTGITLAEMLESRLNRLPAGARQLLETLTVAGRPTDSEVAYAAAGLNGDERSLLASLRSAHFLRSSGSLQRVELYHDRIREALAGMLEPEAKRQIHRRLARTLEAQGFDDPEALFEHYLGGGNRSRAALEAERAARKAADALAFDRAALFYRRAIELAEFEGDHLNELKSGLADALANAGRAAEAALAYMDASRDLITATALEFQRRAAEQFLISGHIDEGLSVIRDVLGAVGMKMASTPRRAFWSLVLRRAQLRLRGLKYVERNADEVPEEDLLRIDTCWAVSTGLALVDSIRGAGFQTCHLLLALKAGEPYRLAKAMAVEAGFTATKGGPAKKRARHMVKASEELARKVDHPHAKGLATMTAGVANYLVGEWKKAADLCERAAEILRDQCTGVTWELTSSNRFMLSSLVYMGELAEVSRRLPLLIATAKEKGNLHAATDLRTRMNLVWLAADDPNRARQEVIEALQQWPQEGFHLQHYNSLFALAQIELYTGDDLVAYKHIQLHWSDMEASMLLRIQAVRIEATHLRARTALAAAVSGNETPRLLKFAERLARRLEREKMIWSEAYAQFVRAGIAGFRGDQSRAADLLSAAAQGFDSADMGLYRAAAHRRLGEVIGGDKGQNLIVEADEWMAKQNIKNPKRLTRMLAPGFAQNSGD